VNCVKSTTICITPMQSNIIIFAKKEIMKKKLLSIVTLVALFLPRAGDAQAPNLGTAANFVLFTTVGALNNTGPSQLTGNVGSNNGSSTGFGNVNGLMANGNGTTATAAADLLTAYNFLNSATAGFFPSSLLGNGDTLNAGVYSISGTSSLSNTLTLNGQGNSGAVFIFKLGGAFSTAALSQIRLINGAQACNVFWKIEGLVNMASGTIMKGTVIVNNAAITLNAGVKLEGRALTTSGAISINSVTAGTPIGCGSPTLTGPALPTLGAAGCYGILSGNGPVSNSGATYVSGDVGTNVGLTTGFNPLNISGVLHPIPDGSTNGAASSLLSSYTSINMLAYDIELLYPAQLGSNLVLTPHVYRMNGAATLTDTLYLNGGGNANAVFVIQINGAFSAGSNAKIILTNGTQASNVFWKIEGSVLFGSNVDFKGTILANNGAINLGTGVSVQGRVLTTNGALSVDAATITAAGTSAPALTITAVNSIVCPGLSTTLTVSGASSYSWSNSSTSNSIVVSPTVTSNYSVSGTSTNGGCGSFGAKTISVSSSPTITATSGTICAGSTYTIVTSGATTYTFSSGNGTVSPTSNTSYSVTGSNSLGCVSNVAAVSIITVQPRPTIGVNSGAICVGKSFVMIPTGANTYTFSNGSATVSPVSNTSYSVSGTSSLGCVSNISAVSSVTANPLPVISVNSGSVCLGNVFTMIPSGASSYTFSNGSSTVAPAINSSYTVNGTSALGCTTTAFATSSITIVASPVVAVNSGSICDGANFTMIPTGASTYTFSNGSAVVNPTINSTYSVTGTSAAGCISTNTAVASVIVYALPTVSINSGAICIGESFTLIASGANTYTYSSGSSIVSPLANTIYSVAGTNAAGCVSNPMASTELTVHALPVISVNSGSICAGQSFTLFPSGATFYTISGGSNIVSPMVTTIYSVTGTDNNGCVSNPAITSNIEVVALPVVAVNSGTICAGQSFTVIPTGATTYTFLNGSNIVSPTANTSYSVTGTNTAGCVSSAAAISNVTVHALPVLVLSTSANTICAGETATLTANGAPAYVWNGGETTSTILVTPAVDTQYTVTATSDFGCKTIGTISQIVDMCTGVNEINQTLVNFNFFPNPNDGVFTVNVKEDVTMYVVNSVGQVVYQQQLVLGDNTIAAYNFANGIYYLNIGAKTQKMIVAGN